MVQPSWPVNFYWVKLQYDIGTLATIFMWTWSWAIKFYVSSKVLSNRIVFSIDFGFKRSCQLHLSSSFMFRTLSCLICRADGVLLGMDSHLDCFTALIVQSCYFVWPTVRILFRLSYVILHRWVDWYDFYLWHHGTCFIVYPKLESYFDGFKSRVLTQNFRYYCTLGRPDYGEIHDT